MKNSLPILVIGLSYKSTPAEIREQLTFPRSRLPDALHIFKSQGLEGLILSTCHRIEIFIYTENCQQGKEKIIRIISQFHNKSSEEFEKYLYTYHGENAVRHLFKVVGGIDSMVIGEPQILGQVREAYKSALKQKTISGIFSQLFQYAINLGKRIRSSTDLKKISKTTSRAAVSLIKKVSHPTKIHDLGFLIIGAGDVARLTGFLLSKEGVKDIQISSRTYEHAHNLAQVIGGKGWTLDSIGQLVKDADVVVSALDVEQPIIPTGAIDEISSGEKRKKVFVDMGMPRNIDPQLNELDHIAVYNVDDLEMAVGGLTGQQELIYQQAVEYIENEVDEFILRYQTLDIVPTITMIKSKMVDIRNQELERFRSKLDILSQPHLETIDALLDGIINKLLYLHIVSLKQKIGHPQERIYRDLLHDIYETSLNRRDTSRGKGNYVPINSLASPEENTKHAKNGTGNEYSST